MRSPSSDELRILSFAQLTTDCKSGAMGAHAGAPALQLLNDFQRGFPLAHAPFAEVGARIGQSEAWVLRMLQAGTARGAISRVGAVFAPRIFGASVLAALRVPAAQLERVGQLVSRYSEVNHNYEREHAYNLWFVATAANAQSLDAVLSRIEADAECGPLLALPLLDEYRIDLGFDLSSDFAAAPTTHTRSPTPLTLSVSEKSLVAALQPGLELVPHPYAALAQRARITEHDCIEMLGRWIDDGTIRRFGIIVRHRKLGFRANAMVVWDIPDALTTAYGLRLSHQPGVTLAYRRGRALPDWRYNLFCMVHGRDRAAVEEHIEKLRVECGLVGFPSQTLFSRRCFKQRGARYFETMESPGV